MRFLMLILFLCIGFNLGATNANEHLKKLSVKPEFFYETPFNHQCFERISNAKIVNAGFAYRSSEKDLEIFSSNHFFLLNSGNVNVFQTVYQLVTSPDFLKTLRNDFKINTKDNAAIFQDLLYLIDQRSSWTSFFKQDNNWYFIRRTMFDDIEAWKVNTDASGTILSIEFSEKMEIEKPVEVFETDYPAVDYEVLTDYILSDSYIQAIEKILKEKIKYKESAEQYTNETLGAISDATFYKFSFTLEEKVEDLEYGTYTSSTNQVFEAIDFNDTMQLFQNFTEILESSLFLESLKPSFELKEDADASIFEAMLDVFTNYMSNDKMILFEDQVWYLVREESFGNKVGFVVKVDTEGDIRSIKYSNPIGIEIIEEEFDETTADWGFKLFMPESNSIEIVEGSKVEYGIEFNPKPVTKMGAWIFASLNNENLDMYFGTELESPHYGDIRSEKLPIGKHTLDVYLMRPGNDTATALNRASVEINVVPFNDEGVVWDFAMEKPQSNTVKAKVGESIPVTFTFNAERVNSMGVRFEIYFEGELVGGRKAPHLQSPLKTDIPGSELKKGNNKIEFVFAGGAKKLAKFELNVEVK